MCIRDRYFGGIASSMWTWSGIRCPSLISIPLYWQSFLKISPRSDLIWSVSYTHLDVYKRQTTDCSMCGSLVYTPWLVPTQIPREVQPVRSTNSLAAAGSV